MRAIIKGKWIVLIAWIAIIAGLFFIAPNMADLVREKGQVNVPEGYSSHLAGQIMEDVQKQEGGGDETQVALVFHEKHKLTKEEINEAEKAVRQLEDHKKQLGITKILTHFNEKNLKDQLVSKDGKSILVSVNVSWNDRQSGDVSDALYKTIDNIKVDHYYTSNWMINDDLTKSSEEGLKKTEGITVVFILGVLFLVFRSAIAPFIPLVTVGLSYLASQSIVSILVDKLDFPISNYTQIFLVAVLFGIGTDYCILLLSRFKEELAQRETMTEAIVETYKNAGRTVFFSGIAVMIGFAAIGFSQFKLYQSASAVAVGVALLLIALFTVVPFFMAVLGKKIFWPSKKIADHGESRLWGAAGRFALARPLIALIIVAAICVPFLVTYDGKLSFNSLEEISGDVPSIKAFNAIADGFGPGESMPTQIVIKNDDQMNSTEYITIAEKISQELKKIDSVETVRSVTRPTGEPIKEFYVSNQAESLGKGLGEGKTGLDKINSGLEKAGSELSQSQPQIKQAENGVNNLIAGTDKVKNGVVALQSKLQQIEDGLNRNAAGSTKLKNGLLQAKSDVINLLNNYQKLAATYSTLGSDLSKLSSNYTNVRSEASSLSGEFNKITDQNFTDLEQKYAGLGNDNEYKNIKNTFKDGQRQLPDLATKLKTLNENLDKINTGISKVNENFVTANSQKEKVITGFNQLIDGINKIEPGLNQLAAGQGQIVDRFPELTNGLSGISEGQKKILNGYADLEDQLAQLTKGLDQSTNGLNQVSEGLGSAQGYLSGLSDTSDMNGFYLPKDVLESKDFAQAIDAYMSKDRKVMTMDVIFSDSPYSNKAMGKVDDIKAAVKRAVKGTKLENATVAVGGITSINADLHQMSSQDYSRTVVLMLVGISIILIFLFRSIIMPLYIIGSLILTYYTSMAMNEALYVNLLGYTGISWAVPFFGFVILVALGVDYSIFLMDRFNEYKTLSVADAMLMAMRRMGTVIISAVVILGGTFAAMMPSGMLSLLQIASIILIGLLLYAFVVLPLFIPVMVKNFGKANWWPFKRETM
ncbi:efflux RND transporter permease subunit [Falsibacillus pallidus]|uniref:efflux RND transporter permease subunit n=1 Tax=Falsibacillus pallidus TaxID=493781 RepID=UPI003D99F9D8